MASFVLWKTCICEDRKLINKTNKLKAKCPWPAEGIVRQRQIQYPLCKTGFAAPGKVTLHNTFDSLPDSFICLPNLKLNQHGLNSSIMHRL